METACDAVLLVAHGAREPGANEAFLDFARRVGEAAAPRRVGAAFSDFGAPGLDEGLSRAADGAARLVVLPCALFRGGMTRKIDEAVAALRRDRPGLAAAVAAPLGFDERLVGLALARVRGAETPAEAPPAAARAALPGLPGFEDDRGCYACGERNPEGLRLAFDLDRAARTLSTEVVFRDAHQGWRGVVHGGFLGLVLDELMVNLAVLLGLGAVTAEMSLRLRRPARVGVLTRGTARLGETRGRLVLASADLLQDGEAVASATGKLLRPSA